MDAERRRRRCHRHEGSNFDTYLGVLDGADFTTATLLDSDDDSGGGLQSYLELPVTAGATYYITVSGFGSSSVGDVVLTWSLLSNDPPVATDDSLEVRGTAPGTVSVLDNDTDPDGDPLTITGWTDPAPAPSPARRRLHLPGGRERRGDRQLHLHRLRRSRR